MSLKPRLTTFANNPLDRAGHERADPGWVGEKLNSPDSLIMLLWNGMPLVLPEAQAGAGRDVAWLPHPAIKAFLNLADTEPVFLGINTRGAPRFYLDISAIPDPTTDAALAPMMSAGGAFENLRELAVAADMPGGELAIIAQAKGLAEWHNMNPFCSRCGTKTEIEEAGYKRRCPSCGAEHFPRTDPVVIMLPIKGDQALLGRQAGWPEALFSALAGFMEPGETIEEAVARETMEEAGLPVTQVRYHATQPWPFPASLMIGCHAEVDHMDFTVDEKELAEARWFSRDELKRAMVGDSDLMVPPSMAIAHQLIKAFVEASDGFSR